MVQTSVSDVHTRRSDLWKYQRLAAAGETSTSGRDVQRPPSQSVARRDDNYAAHPLTWRFPDRRRRGKTTRDVVCRRPVINGTREQEEAEQRRSRGGAERVLFFGF